MGSMNFNNEKMTKALYTFLFGVGVLACSMIVYANFNLKYINWKEVVFTLIGLGFFFFIIMAWRGKI